MCMKKSGAYSLSAAFSLGNGNRDGFILTCSMLKKSLVKIEINITFAH